ncbi:MAG: U32 family peptidase [Gammaproteobacteria bacterium]|nr:U32 family peptidase [Gammaproteobacteria bacterium]
MGGASRRVELVCPAGSMPALRAAVGNGADAVYVGLRGETNARNFPGLNFEPDRLRQAIDLAQAAGVRVFMAVNTYPTPRRWAEAARAIDHAAGLGVDALILADPGLLRYAARRYPYLRLHLSVQASATNRDAIAFYDEQFGVQRVVLPRVLSLAQVRRVVEGCPVGVEVFGFGSLCVMAEGRCTLSSYVTGESPNQCGVCAPARAVRWVETERGREARLNGVLIDRFGDEEAAGYPVPCKGRYRVAGRVLHAIEEPTSLNVLDILPELVRLGVAALKIEGRQRSPAYVAQVTRTMREALDACQADPDRFVPRPEWLAALDRHSEGRTHTLGALQRRWQ